MDDEILYHLMTWHDGFLPTVGLVYSLTFNWGKLRKRLTAWYDGLVDAFKATLQEAVDADLLLHVVDAANPHHPEQIAEVQQVLADIGATEVPQLLVLIWTTPVLSR